MTRKKQNKILDAKIESNVNQYKVDRLNAEISAFSSSDLNKYEFLKRIDLNYKPNALDKARFEFSPLGKTFSAGLDKTAQGYQEEGVMKLLKDIRDSVRGGARPPGPDDNNDDNNDNNDDNNDDDNNDDNNDSLDYDDDSLDYDEYKEFVSPLLEEINNKKYTNYDDDDDKEEISNKKYSNYDDKVFNVLNEFKNNMENKMSDLDKMVKSKEDEWKSKLNKLNNDTKKIGNYI